MENPCKNCMLIPYYACFCYKKARYDMENRVMKKEEKNGLVDDSNMYCNCGISSKVS